MQPVAIRFDQKRPRAAVPEGRHRRRGRRLPERGRLRVYDGRRILQTLSRPAEGWATAAVAPAPLDTGAWRLLVDLPGLPQVPPAAFHVDVAEDFPVARPYYADLHVHAHDTVGTNSPAYNARHARDVGGVDVFGYTASDFQITAAHWAAGLAQVRPFDRPGEFVVYPVQEWCGSSTAGGDHNVVFLGDAAPDFPYNARGEHGRTFLWNEDMKGHEVQRGRWPVEALWAAYADDAEHHLLLPHVGGRRHVPDWHHPQLERLVEIASTWGHFGWLYQDAIARGYRLGAAANREEHRGRPGGGALGVQVFGAHGGLTGVLADALDKRSIGRALRAPHLDHHRRALGRAGAVRPAPPGRRLRAPRRCHAGVPLPRPDIAFRSGTYGDADSIEIEVSRLAELRIVEGTIDACIKVGNPLARNPAVQCPEFRWAVQGDELLQAGRQHRALGGTELFLALERLTDAPLPAGVAGVAGGVVVDARNAPFGHRPVYFHGRERDDSKVWSSAQFIRVDAA